MFSRALLAHLIFFGIIWDFFSILTNMLFVHILSYMTRYANIQPKFYLSKWNKSKNHQKPWNCKVDKLKKSCEGFGIRSAPRQGQPNSWSNLVGRPSYRLCYKARWKSAIFDWIQIFTFCILWMEQIYYYLLFGVLIILHCSYLIIEFSLWVIVAVYLVV